MASNAREKSQYHHYVPRFMLRKWQVECVPPEKHEDASGNPPVNNPKKKGGGKGKGRQRSMRQPPEEYINMYDVENDALRTGILLSKAYGTIDMYKNDDDPDNVYHIEKLFSGLESQAAEILRRLDNVITGPQASSSISLSRRDVNTLRKFLFLMSYRSGSHGRQFREELFDQRTRDEVEAFRLKYGLKDIPSVWLFNLKNMLETEPWEIFNNEKILGSDRDLYRTHMQYMQLAFYVVPDDCELILTDNGLGLWEGTYLPTLSLFSAPDSNGRSLCWRHTTTYPVSPRLLIMLRTTFMGNQPHLRNMGLPSDYAAFGDVVPDDSYFKDFPRTLAVVQYNPKLSKPPHQCFSPDGESIDGMKKGSRVKDVFTFRIHQLTGEQANRVNALRLENLPRTITFKSAQKLLSSIHCHEITAGPKNAGAHVKDFTPYSKPSYAALKIQLQHYLEHGVPFARVPPDPVSIPEPVATNSPACPNPPISAPHPIDSSPGAPSQDMSLIERLRTRSTAASGSTATRPTSADQGALESQQHPSLSEKDSGEFAAATSSPQGAHAPSGQSYREQQTNARNKAERSAPLKVRKPRLRRQVYATPASVEAGTRLLLKHLVTEFSQAGSSRDTVQITRGLVDTTAAEAAATVGSPPSWKSWHETTRSAPKVPEDSDDTDDWSTTAQGGRYEWPKQPLSHSRRMSHSEHQRVAQTRHAASLDESEVSNSGYASHEIPGGWYGGSPEIEEDAETEEDSWEETNERTSRRSRYHDRKRGHRRDDSADAAWKFEGAASNTFSTGSVLMMFTGILVTLALKLVIK